MSRHLVARATVAALTGVTVVGALALPASARPEPGTIQSSVADPGFETLDPPVTGETYYVSGAGDDDADGLTEQTAFRTLQKAAGFTQPGDQVLVMDGNYTKAGPRTNVLDITTGGQPDAYITWSAYPGHQPVVNVSDNYAGIRTSVPYVVIEGFTVQGRSSELDAAEAERLARGTDYAAAMDNTVYNSSGIASYPDSSAGTAPHHLIIRNNRVFDHPGSGIFSNGSDYVRIENNVVHDNSEYSPYATSGISFYQSTAVDSSTDVKMWVRGNVSYRNENRVPFWFSSSDPAQRVISDGNGIIVDDARHSQQGDDDPGGGGAPYVGTFLIENNVVSANGGRGLNVYESDDVVARNNTLHGNGQTTGFTELQVYEADSVRLEGNIVAADDDREFLNTAEATNVSYTNNLFDGGTGGTYPAGTGNITGQDPRFVSVSGDPAQSDFRLQPGSPAIDAQTVTAPAQDIDGTSRPQGAASDLGAYESTG
jgi:parallel beta-helix repeat protein